MCACVAVPRASAIARAHIFACPTAAARRGVLVKASSSPDPDAGPTTMSLEEAEKVLQVAHGADFDTIMNAKQKLLGSVGKDDDRKFQIEAAYDVIFMQKMRARLSGDVRASIKYADVPVKKNTSQVQQSLLSKLPGSISTSIPPNNQLGILGGGYAALALWAFLQGATEPYAAQQADVAGLQLALGFAGAVYFLRDRKRLGLGRAFAYATLGLIAGATVGNLIEPWLRVDIVPLFGMGSPGVFVAEFGLIGLAVAAAVLA
eukprot:jgi/Ulvmu1/6627/UM003_0265.1